MCLHLFESEKGRKIGFRVASPGELRPTVGDSSGARLWARPAPTDGQTGGSTNVEAPVGQSVGAVGAIAPWLVF